MKWCSRIDSFQDDAMKTRDVLIDLNKDNLLSKDEVSNLHFAVPPEDKNGDGSYDFDELLASKRATQADSTERHGTEFLPGEALSVPLLTDRSQFSIPLFERAFIQNLGDALRCRYIKMILALGTNVLKAFGFFAIDGFAAAWAFNPQAIGYAAFLFRRQLTPNRSRGGSRLCRSNRISVRLRSVDDGHAVIPFETPEPAGPSCPFD